jgi:hypothetical protein
MNYIITGIVCNILESRRKWCFCPIYRQLPLKKPLLTDLVSQYAFVKAEGRPAGTPFLQSGRSMLLAQNCSLLPSAGHPAPVPEQENRSPGFSPSLSDEKKAPDLSPKPFDF